MILAQPHGFTHPIPRERLTRLPFIPVPDHPLFPGACLDIEATDPMYQRVVRDALKADGFIALVLSHPEETWQDDEPWFHELAALGKILHPLETTPEGVSFRCCGVGRIWVTREYEVDELDYALLEARPAPTRLGKPLDILNTQLAPLAAALPALRQLDPELADAINELFEAKKQPGTIADTLLPFLLEDDPDLQRAMFLELRDAPRVRLAVDRFWDILGELQQAALAQRQGARD